MCFSATASFTASGILGVIGFYALHKARKKEVPLALIPLCFSIQQALEGITWLTYGNPAYSLLSLGAIYGFGFFAFIFWPFWVPLSILMLEEDHHRIPLLRLLLILGSAIATFLLLTITKNGIGTIINCHHIHYDLFLPPLIRTVGGALYCIAIIVSCFVSSRKWIPFFGLLVAGSVAITYFFYYAFFASVWCFFAALLSMVIVLIL